MEKVDFVSIGDTVVDDFIKLKEAEAHCDINNENCTICMRFGDKIPFESSTVVYGVGNAANAAVAAARLGLKTAYISNIGKDDRAERILERFKEEGVDATHVVEHAGIPTNYHYVLWFGTERTILVKHQHYPYIFPPDAPAAKTVYLSSLADGTETYHDAIAAYLEANPETFFAFQPGTFQIQMGPQRLGRLYARCNFFVCNKEEAARILGMAVGTETLELAKKLHALGPKIVMITDGVKGVDAFENGTFFHVPMFPDPKPPFQRTGAGDAFASTTVAYLTMGMPLKDAALRGTINSAYVVQKIGAQAGLLKKDELENILAHTDHAKT
ncbi:MAG: carbohydrate kinase family protein [Patescibacteria group bacterium]|nr:carbohydrate kinase family protein [Patescibacteria group bacterium]